MEMRTPEGPRCRCLARNEMRRPVQRLPAERHKRHMERHSRSTNTMDEPSLRLHRFCARDWADGAISDHVTVEAAVDNAP
eukprot:2884031-Pleurochrysis_carterae.AAC.1